MKIILGQIAILTLIITTASCSQNRANIREGELAKRFSNQVAEKGKDSDHSLARLTLKRDNANSLIVTAEAWGVSETGPFIKVQRKGHSLVFYTLAHCGTIESSTPVKLRETYILSDIEELQILSIELLHNDQIVRISK
jgi:hypothetical protein